MIPEVLRAEAQFRLLFAGQVLSIVGDRVMLVAVAVRGARGRRRRRTVGLVVGAQLVPFLVFALYRRGDLSDRADRRRVLIASDVLRLAVQAVAATLLLTGNATPLVLGVLAALYGSADAFFQPAFTGLLPQTVSHPGQLQPANALRGLSFSVLGDRRARDRPVCSSPSTARAARWRSTRSRSGSAWPFLLRLRPPRGRARRRGDAAAVPAARCARAGA